MRASEDAGGLGLSRLDMALVAEEAGRSLASAPLVETIAAARLLGQLDGAASPLVEEIAGGAVAVLALHPIERGVAQVVPGAAAALRSPPDRADRPSPARRTIRDSACGSA